MADSQIDWAVPVPAYLFQIPLNLRTIIVVKQHLIIMNVCVNTTFKHICINTFKPLRN